MKNEKVKTKVMALAVCMVILMSFSGIVSAEIIGETEKGTEYYAVIVGVSDYKYLSDLSYCDDDAIDIYNRLLSYPNWKATNIKLLIDSDAEKADIEAAIDWMKTEADADDICLFTFSGHGCYGDDVSPYDEADGYDEYFCPYDSLTSSYANDISDDEFESLMDTINAKKVVILDTCFAGGFIKTDKYTVRTKPGVPKAEKIIDGFAKDLDKTSYVVLTASDDDEYSYESSVLRNGVFSYYVEEGLSGPADYTADGEISAEETFTYAEPKTISYTGGDQHPQSYDGVAGDVTVVSARPTEEHDIGVTDLTAPSHAEPGERINVNATITNRGNHSESNIEVQFLVEGYLTDAQTITALTVGSSAGVNFKWSTSTEGTYNLSVYAVPVPGETYTADNIRSTSIRISTGKMVLFDQTHGTDSISDYSKWVSELEAQGCIVDELYGAITTSTLAGYNVFVIPQAQSSYTSSERSAIQSFVTGGGGLFVIGDDKPSIYTDLTDFAGITWSSGGHGEMCTDITPHEVTMGVNSAYFHSPVSELYASGAAQDLIRDDYGDIMLAVSESPGRVVGVADEHCLNDGYIDMDDNMVLGINIIDWLGGIERFRLTITTDKTVYNVGEDVLVTIGLENPTDDWFRIYLKFGITWPSGDGMSMVKTDGFYVEPDTTSTTGPFPMPIYDYWMVPNGRHAYWISAHDYYTHQQISYAAAPFNVTRPVAAIKTVESLSELAEIG